MSWITGQSKSWGARWTSNKAGCIVIPQAPTFAEIMLATAPEGWWRFGDNVGVIAVDSSGNERHGVYLRSTEPQGVGFFSAEGLVANDPDFGAYTSREGAGTGSIHVPFAYPTSTESVILQPEFTIQVVCKPEWSGGYASDQALLHVGETGSGGGLQLMVACSGPSFTLFILGYGGGLAWNPGMYWPVGDVYTIHLQKKPDIGAPDTFSVYVDGVQYGGSPSSASPYTQLGTSPRIYFGKRDWIYQYQGYIDEGAYWRRALSVEEMMAISNSVKGLT